MANDQPNSADTAQIMHSIGQLTGAVTALNQGLTARIEDIRQDIRRIEHAQTERLDRVENNLVAQIDQVREDVNKRFDGVSKSFDSLGSRVTNLEAEDKRLIEKTAKLSALGGGVGGALAAAAVELIKRL